MRRKDRQRCLGELQRSSRPWREDAPRPQEAGIWDVPADACADPGVLSAVQAVLDAPQDGVANSVLARPDEVAADSRDQQVVAWQALTPEELAFQHCLSAKGSGS